jgi:hypothetical protein
MKSVEMAWSLALLMTVILICWISYACYRFIEATIASIPCEAFIILGVVCCASFGLIVSGGSIYIVRWMSYRSRHIFAKNGLYPHVYNGQGFVNLNEDGSQRIAALSSCKPSASVISKVAESWQQIGNQDPAMIPGPAAESKPTLTVEEVMNSNPKVSPHWLLIGSTGSGKTCASYGILSQLNQLHSCEFVITEPGGVNWGNQAKATKTVDIANVIIDINKEMERRQELLRKNDVDHVSELPNPLPYIVLVSEETDSVFDDLRLTDKALRTAAIIALRGIARMGRKAGVCLVAVSQSGTVDVFDSHVRKNLGNVLLFRSEHTVADAWRVGEKLNSLRAGMAYSVPHSDFVQFGYQQRPQLAQGAYQKAVQCDTPVVPFVPVLGGCSAVVQRLERGCEPDEQLAEQLRQLHQSGTSKTKLCEQVWGYKDGVVFGILNRILGVPSIQEVL